MKRLWILVFILIYSVVLKGINPPQVGNFPSGFWDKMEQQGIGQVYGDPGWLRKIADWKNNPLRDAQLEFYLPVLLGQYADVTETYFDAVDFQNLLFDDNSTGTMKEYYNEISYGNFLVDGTADGWYQSTHTMAQAVDNVKQYVAEIAELADPDFDYTQFDNDGPDNIPNSGDDDGYVDGIIVVYSGCGAEWYPGNDNIWPHKSSLGSYEYETDDLGANGSNVIVKSYAVNPELAGGGDCYTNTIRPIGVYAHEFGHILGLPDLYDRDNSNGGSEGIGHWCLMASGSWQGWGGDTPAHMSSWCKSEMGWLEPVVLSSDEISLNIPQVETNPYAVKIWEDDYFWSRYFLVENRQPVGFDSDLEGPGLIIYHVDENRRYGSYRFSSGPANDDETHKLVDVEEADGLDDMDNEVNRGDAGDPFPGTSNNFTFNDNSYPSASRYDNTETGIAVFNISSSDSLMTADVNIRPQYGYALAYDELGMSGSGWGYNDSRTHFGGVLFTPDVSGFLTEVDVGIRKAPIDFHILVYNSFDGTSPGSLLDSVAGYADDATWFSVPIDTVPVSAGVDFFIAVRMDTSYAISVDRWGEKDYRSYFSTNGMTYSTGIADYGDINLRAKISEEGIDNNAPIASDGLFTTNEDTDYSGTFSASDAEGDSLTYSILDSTDNGTLILSDPISGTFTYSPIENFNGSDSLTFSVSDGILLDTGTVNITVVGLNDAPSSFALSEQDSVYITMDNFATDSISFTWDESIDVDGDELLYDFTASLIVNGQVKAEYNSSSLTIREMKIDHQSVFDEIFAAQAMFGEIEWDVSVRDSMVEVTSENGALTLGVNASAAVLSINGELLPEVFSLHQNYPNPFNPVTKLRYDLPENGHVNITIYDMLGREVKTLINQTQDAGYRSVIWDATNDYGKPISAGIYLYQIQAGEYMRTKKMVLLK
jgi:M6 family metalloprotease-like protein